MWATYVQQAGVPVVGLNSSSEPFYTNSDFYPEGQTEDSLFLAITAFNGAKASWHVGDSAQ